MKAKVAILGASGFAGAELLRRLLIKRVGRFQLRSRGLKALAIRFKGSGAMAEATR